MTRTAAILGTCLKLLALVDSIALSKVSVSKHNVGWEKVEYWLPDDQRDNFLKNYPFSNNYLDVIPMQSSINNVQYRTQGTPSDDLSYGGLMGQRPNAELASNTPSKNLMPPNHVFDNWQRKSTSNDPYIKLKLKLKIKLPPSSGSAEINVSEPEQETVIDKESQLSKQYPANTPSPDPFVRAYDRVDHVAKNLPEPVKDVGKLEKLYHSDRSPIPFEVQEITNPEDIQSKEELENILTDTAKVDALLAYVDKLQQQLKDAVTKLTGKPALTDYDQSSRETKSHLSEHLPGDQNTTPATVLDPSVIAYDRIDSFSKNLPNSVEKMGQSEKLHPMPYKAQEEVKQSDIQPAGQYEEEYYPQSPVPDMEKRETTQIDTYSSKLHQPGDDLNKPTEKATQTDHDESEPTEMKSQLSEDLHGEPFNERQQQSDDFRSKRDTELKTSPILDLEDHKRVRRRVHFSASFGTIMVGNSYLVR